MINNKFSIEGTFARRNWREVRRDNTVKKPAFRRLPPSTRPRGEHIGENMRQIPAEVTTKYSTTKGILPLPARRKQKSYPESQQNIPRQPCVSVAVFQFELSDAASSPHSHPLSPPLKLFLSDFASRCSPIPYFFLCLRLCVFLRLRTRWASPEVWNSNTPKVLRQE